MNTSGISENQQTSRRPTTPNCTQSTSGTSLARPSKRKLNVMEQVTLETMKVVGEIIESVKGDDPFDIFGKHVADRLRAVKQNQVKFAQKLISDVLFEADMESLNRFSKLSGTFDQTPQYSSQPTGINYHPDFTYSMHQMGNNVPQQPLITPQSKISPCSSSYTSAGSSAQDYLETFNPNSN